MFAVHNLLFTNTRLLYVLHVHVYIFFFKPCIISSAYWYKLSIILAWQIHNRMLLATITFCVNFLSYEYTKINFKNHNKVSQESQSIMLIYNMYIILSVACTCKTNDRRYHLYKSNNVHSTPNLSVFYTCFFF